MQAQKRTVKERLRSRKKLERVELGAKETRRQPLRNASECVNGIMAFNNKVITLRRDVPGRGYGRGKDLYEP